jgi:guanosine-3',5'-bis(diphosphate) 3'-pyrophosphohydrolase
LIETAYAERKRPYGVIYRDGDVGMFDPARRAQVIKIHGTITDPQSLVFRKSQYEVFWKERPLLRSLLVTLAATRSFLFLGYGFGDPNILDLLEMLRGAMAGGGREHFALVYEDREMDRQWRRLGVTVIKAPDDPGGSEPSYESRTLQFLRELSHQSRTVAVSNFDRARLINSEIERLIVRAPIKPVLRMRGSLGWLSNPEPQADDPIYGSPQQDREERRMTELVADFLQKCAGSSARCILHIDSQPLADKYRARHLRRRLEQIKAMIEAFPRQISIVHDQLPSYSNHMFFDDAASLLGFKAQSEEGISRVVVVRDPTTVRTEIEQFEWDFDRLQEENRLLADPLGVNVAEEGWLRQFILKLIDSELNRLAEEGAPAGLRLHSRLAEALAFAILKHAECGQLREDGRTPYGVHPLRVVERLRAFAEVEDEEILIAAALHDVVEDCNVTAAEIEARFGGRIGGVVDELTQRKDEPEAGYADRLQRSSREAKIVKLADRWDNVSEVRKLGLQTFGGVSTVAYLESSQRILEACREGSRRLARYLEDEILATRAGFGV